MNEPETPLSRREAERLLDAPAAHDSDLGRVLAAVQSPAHPEELRREDATVAAFHSARLTPPPATRKAFVSPTRLGGRAAVHAVVATAAVVSMASGGFALAGAVDLPSLPTLPGQASDRATEAVSEARDGATSATAGSPTGRPGGSATGKPTKSPSTTSSETPSATASPTPNLPGLCQALQATDRSDDGKALDSAAFSALATAAGGADNVATYCVSLIGAPETAKPTGKPTDRPTPTTTPTDKPTGQPPTVPTPTGKPTDKPTDRPTDKPSPGKPSPGKPTDKPGQSGNGGGKDSTTSGS